MSPSLIHNAAYSRLLIAAAQLGQRPIINWPGLTVPSTHRVSEDDSTTSVPADPAAASETDRPLITYVYSESQEARRNLAFFIAHGLHAEADFVFIFNGVTDAISLVPEMTGVRSIQRDNTCYDLGSHAEVLLKGDLWRRYDRFILMNASVRGPFMPAWADGLCWTERLSSRITQEVKVCKCLIQSQSPFHKIIHMHTYIRARQRGESSCNTGLNLIY